LVRRCATVVAGPIPKELAALSNLKNLSLFNNKLTREKSHSPSGSYSEC